MYCRHGVPYSYGQKNPLVPIVLINYVRVIEVWFDEEHKDWFYRREPQVLLFTIT